MNMNSLSRWQRPQVAIWPGFGRVFELQDDLAGLFDEPLAELVRSRQSLGGWAPALDMYEVKDSVIVRAELPGMKKEEIEVSLHDGCLTLSGERKSGQPGEESEAHRSERFFGRFQRTISLPTQVATDKVKAQYKDGVLSITMPKAEEAKPRHIDVHAS